MKSRLAALLEHLPDGSVPRRLRARPPDPGPFCRSRVGQRSIRTPIATHLLRSAIAGVMTLLCLASPSWGQDVTEPSLKAALIYNLARFTEWPDDVLSPNSSFTACVLGDSPVGDALDHAVKDRQLGGHPVRVAHVGADGPFRPCHLMYVSNLTPAQLVRLSGALRGLPVLTIIDTDSFTVVGCIARLFVENGKLRFDLDHGLAKRSRLQLSSKLLSLASHVQEEPSMVTR
jgi:YfiR/HmsC-like